MPSFLAETENIKKKRRSERPKHNCGKVANKNSGKLLFAISVKKSESRAVLFLAENNQLRRESNPEWTRVNLGWKGGQPKSPTGPDQNLFLE